MLDEKDAVRHCMTRANPGDLVVLCVDQHNEVVTELEGWSHHAQAGARSSEDAVSDPDLDPAELTELAGRDEQPARA